MDSMPKIQWSFIYYQNAIDHPKKEVNGKEILVDNNIL